MKIILLPGMDGTGILLKTFAAYVNGDVSILSYDTAQKQDYSTLAQFVSNHLHAHETYFLIAESFSGPIAYELLKVKPNIVSVVFVASFITPPNPALVITKFLPNWLINAKIPHWAAKFLLGHMASNDLVTLFQQTVKRVPHGVLSDRIQAMLNLKLIPHNIQTRCAYIRPNRDILVSSACINAIKTQCQHLITYAVDGSHFVLQVNPKAVAALVNHEIHLATHPIRQE